MRTCQRWGLSITAGIALAALLLVSSVAAETEPVPEAASEAEAPLADGPSPPNLAEQREKERRVLAGMAALAAIVIVGVALITLIILWAGRLRRLNREPLPSTNVQNEFWFLRPPKPPVSDRGPDATSDESS